MSVMDSRIDDSNHRRCTPLAISHAFGASIWDMPQRAGIGRVIRLRRHCLNDVVRFDVQNVRLVGKRLEQAREVVIAGPHQVKREPVVDFLELRSGGSPAHSREHVTVVAAAQKRRLLIAVYRD